MSSDDVVTRLTEAIFDGKVQTKQLFYANSRTPPLWSFKAQHELKYEKGSMVVKTFNKETGSLHTGKLMTPPMELSRYTHLCSTGNYKPGDKKAASTLQEAKQKIIVQIPVGDPRFAHFIDEGEKLTDQMLDIVTDLDYEHEHGWGEILENLKKTPGYTTEEGKKKVLEQPHMNCLYAQCHRPERSSKTKVKIETESYRGSFQVAKNTRRIPMVANVVGEGVLGEESDYSSKEFYEILKKEWGETQEKKKFKGQQRAVPVFDIVGNKLPLDLLELMDESHPSGLYAIVTYGLSNKVFAGFSQNRELAPKLAVYFNTVKILATIEEIRKCCIDAKESKEGNVADVLSGLGIPVSTTAEKRKADDVIEALGVKVAKTEESQNSEEDEPMVDIDGNY